MGGRVYLDKIISHYRPCVVSTGRSRAGPLFAAAGSVKLSAFSTLSPDRPPRQRMKPTNKPGNPNFSSGPCSKRPGYDLANLDTRSLGRSHRSALGKELLGRACIETAELLGRGGTRLRYRGHGNGHVVHARGAPGGRACLGILRSGLGHRYRQAIEAGQRQRAQRGVWGTAGPVCCRWGPRRRVHLERHHFRRQGAGR